MKTNEMALEERIESDLISFCGYTKFDGAGYDKHLALCPETLLSYVKSTQSNVWNKYVKIYGERAEKSFIDRFVREVKVKGLIKVLRTGITDRGCVFKVVTFKANTDMNQKLIEDYNANILQVCRQLHYSVSNNNSLDIVLFVNGIPIVTMELKNEYTGQNYENAIYQYKYDRSPNEPIFEFKNRALIHFALDTENVFMTTRLQGENTYFLPFNQGSNGAGNIGGKGNPICEDNYDTSYLWNKVLTKDMLLEILSKYIHLEVSEKDGEKKEVVIFPRFHQLDVVSKLIESIKEIGSGKNYLIQHSAGSGKSNSIAWLAYRLACLHRNNKRVFESVIVVTDRKVLDTQLQDTIYQFDHVDGVVEKIDKGKTSKDLLKAINDGKDIIITTIQKFPRIYKDIIGENKNFAIIVDEAHQSQTGETAKKLKEGLADLEESLEEYAKIENEFENKKLDDDDKLLNEILAQGNHKNLSFFAFTATPKNKTLQLFGDKATNEKGENTYKAFHIYSMRQAIEEGFILDVLANYMTYNTYFKIAKNFPTDPIFDTNKGMKAVTRYETLHPHNLAQKTAVILDHFDKITKYKINGKAKAMIVTPSRLHAVRYLLEFKKQIKEKHLENCDVLVAFSGEVYDNGEKYTEQTLNKDKQGNEIKENQLPKIFHDDFNMLIVAEKYQTGFDEPLLHTMFVDKKLNDVKAVQTLSRLNRICKGKEDTFVLDFVNSAEDIKKAFQPYYEGTILEQETNPNAVYDLKYQLDEMRVYTTSEVNSFADLYFSQNEKDASKLSNYLRPAVDRFLALDKVKRESFKSGLASFIRIYNFITNVEKMFDKELHKFNVYAKFLKMKLPRDNEKVNVDDKVILEYYKLQRSFEGQIKLDHSPDSVIGIKGNLVGKEKKKDPLSIIIQNVNEKFGTAFTETDKILLQLCNDMVNDEVLKEFGKNNPIETFKFMYNDKFDNLVIDRSEQNNKFFENLANDKDFRDSIMQALLPIVFERIRKNK